MSTLQQNSAAEYRRMDSVKALLVSLGSHCNRKTLQLVSSAANYLEVGYWLKSQGFFPLNRVHHRRELFHLIANSVGDKKVLYLEFGVAKGASMRYWSGLLTNPASMLHGFDTFEGLPEDWRLGDKKGAYSAAGCPPEIADPRVKFFQGLFHNTLPGYALPEHERLVINIDCDLYSSTSFVLKSLAGHIQTGTFIYFDEFSDPHNELRAFQEMLNASNRRFRLLGATRSYGQVCFECI